MVKKSAVFALAVLLVNVNVLYVAVGIPAMKGANEVEAGEGYSVASVAGAVGLTEVAEVPEIDVAGSAEAALGSVSERVVPEEVGAGSVGLNLGATKVKILDLGREDGYAEEGGDVKDLEIVDVVADNETVSAESSSIRVTENSVGRNHNGYYLRVLSDNSNIVVIGDSRACQLAEKDTGKASYFTLWGGHYGYGGEKGAIDKEDRLQAMVDWVNSLGEEAVAYVFSTVNDYKGVGDYRSALGNLLSFVGKLKVGCPNCSVKVVSLLGVEGSDVSDFNAGLLESGYEVVDIESLIGGCEVFASDGVHYSKEAVDGILSNL